MAEPRRFSDLSQDDADALQRVYEDDGATVQRTQQEDGTMTLAVSFPDGSIPAAAGNAATVISACDAEWPAHQNDCSAFARAVAHRLGITLNGNANQIVEELRTGASWRRVAGASEGMAAAEKGDFVVAGLKGGEQAAPSEHGHVVVVVSGRVGGNAYPLAYWGRLGGGGQKNRTINWAWRAADRDRIVYAARSI